LRFFGGEISQKNYIAKLKKKTKEIERKQKKPP
jgi:hypothetical protein